MARRRIMSGESREERRYRLRRRELIKRVESESITESELEELLTMHVDMEDVAYVTGMDAEEIRAIASSNSE